MTSKIEAGLRKQKFNYVAFANPDNGGPARSGERKKEGEPHGVDALPSWTNFALALYNPMYQYPSQQYHFSANISPTHYQPRTPNQPQRPPLYRPQNPLNAHPRPNITPNTNQNTNQEKNFPKYKHVEFTPILMSYVDLLSYLLNNAVVAISPTKIP